MVPTIRVNSRDRSGFFFIFFGSFCFSSNQIRHYIAFVLSISAYLDPELLSMFFYSQMNQSILSFYYGYWFQNPRYFLFFSFSSWKYFALSWKVQWVVPFALHLLLLIVDFNSRFCLSIVSSVMQIYKIMLYEYMKHATYKHKEFSEVRVWLLPVRSLLRNHLHYRE